MLEEIIQNFPKQLEYQPEIHNSGSFQKRDKFIVCGMGGSNLAAGIIKSWKPKLDIIIHRDYGLPEMEEMRLKDYSVIVSSYSGNTDETISAFQEAQARGLSSIVIATGGKLLELAQEHITPYIQMPKIDNNPRFAIGLSIRATLKTMGLSSTTLDKSKVVLDEELILNDVRGLAQSLNPDNYEQTSKELAEKLQNKIPLIYSSGPNAGLARYWKISFNETVKLPSFYNFLPELNHNEMAGFSSNPALEKNDGGAFGRRPVFFKGGEFAFIFLNDPDDEPQIQKRMSATQKIFEERGFAVLPVDLTGPSLWHKSFAGILTALWTSYYLAEHYGVDSEDVSMIEDFKKSLAP